MTIINNFLEVLCDSGPVDLDKDYGDRSIYPKLHRVK